MRAQAGFTLVEAVAAALIGSLLAGASLTILLINNAQVKESGGRHFISAYYSAVSQDIQRTARKGRIVKVLGDPAAPVDNPIFTNSPTLLNRDTVVFCGPAGDTVGGFRMLSQGHMQRLERNSSASPWQWRYITFGPNGAKDTVKVIPSSSYFDVYPGRRGIVYVLNLSMKVGGTLESLPELDETESVVCRNAIR